MSGHPLLKAEIAAADGVSTDDVMVVLPPEGIYMAIHCLVDYIKRFGLFVVRTRSSRFSSMAKNSAKMIYSCCTCSSYVINTSNSFCRKNNGQSFHTVCLYPSYQNLFEHLKTNRCEFSYWPAKTTSSGWHFDLENLRAVVKNDTRLLVVNFPHNPTGFQPTSADWAALVEFCRQKDIFLFSDEIYRLVL